MIFLITISVVFVFSSLLLWTHRKFNYWKDRNVKFAKPSLLFGNYGPYILQQKNDGEMIQDLCRQFPDEPMIGAFFGPEPVLIVQGPELLKLIMTKDYYYFNGREVSPYTHKEILTKNMFFTYGDNWKVLRQNMTPLFSSAKTKNMFHLVETCTKVFENLLDDEAKQSEVQEVRSLMARFTMDCVCSAAFGIDTRAMSSDTKTNPFRQISEVIFDTSRSRGFKTVFRAIYPSLFYGLGFNLFPEEIHTFFKTVLLNVFKERRGQPATRHDFVDLINGLKENEYLTGDTIKNMKGEDGEKDKVSIKADDELMIAQCVLFFAAGFETSATTSSFTLYELAKKPDVQQRVLDEIDAYIKERGEVRYDSTHDLPFLNQCLDETLRLYPVLPHLTRDVYEDYTLPNGLKLERCLPIHIPVYHIQRDPKYWSDPDDFNPDRFSPERRKDIVPYSYFPFGEGPRTCLGMRFAKMQMIAGMITLLKKYRVELAQGMPHNVKYESTSMVIQCRSGINLKLVPRAGWEERRFKQRS